MLLKILNPCSCILFCSCIDKTGGFFCIKTRKNYREVNIIRESDIHIFGMNEHYTKLLQFLQNNKLNVCEFMTGASIPFTEVVRPTNTISERDFALLDCYIREKSNAIHMFGISRRRFLKELCSQYDVIDGVLHLQNPATPGWWCIVVP